ncbi:hypothetical protein TWF696_001503 [Orbilia brochopaga]|uniref:Uncharacterized protein n=1 Tax=Orbilia brochopaga TaxID=3140254 RepID=A0AAV9U959_9PEZI
MPRPARTPPCGIYDPAWFFPLPGYESPPAESLPAESLPAEYPSAESQIEWGYHRALEADRQDREGHPLGAHPGPWYGGAPIRASTEYMIFQEVPNVEEVGHGLSFEARYQRGLETFPGNHPSPPLDYLDEQLSELELQSRSTELSPDVEPEPSSAPQTPRQAVAQDVPFPQTSFGYPCVSPGCTICYHKGQGPPGGHHSQVRDQGTQTDPVPAPESDSDTEYDNPLGEVPASAEEVLAHSGDLPKQPSDVFPPAQDATHPYQAEANDASATPAHQPPVEPSYCGHCPLCQVHSERPSLSPLVSDIGPAPPVDEPQDSTNSSLSDGEESTGVVGMTASRILEVNREGDLSQRFESDFGVTPEGWTEIVVPADDSQSSNDGDISEEIGEDSDDDDEWDVIDDGEAYELPDGGVRVRPEDYARSEMGSVGSQEQLWKPDDDTDEWEVESSRSENNAEDGQVIDCPQSDQCDSDWQTDLNSSEEGSGEDWDEDSPESEEESEEDWDEESSESEEGEESSDGEDLEWDEGADSATDSEGSADHWEAEDLDCDEESETEESESEAGESEELSDPDAMGHESDSSDEDFGVMSLESVGSRVDSPVWGPMRPQSVRRLGTEEPCKWGPIAPPAVKDGR